MGKERDSSDKGFNVDTLRYLPSKFKDYKFKELILRDLSLGQTVNLSILGQTKSTSKILDLYSSCFLNLDKTEVEDLLLIDFITAVHYINHMTFGVYSNSFVEDCSCGTKHTMSYDLYSLNFTEPKRKYTKKLKYDKSFTMTLRPFTVKSMIALDEEDLQDDIDAFIAVSVHKINDYTFPKEIAKSLKDLGSFPFRMREVLSTGLQDYYPMVKVLDIVTPCGKTVSVLPDLSLKGLPYLT